MFVGILTSQNGNENISKEDILADEYVGNSALVDISTADESDSNTLNIVDNNVKDVINTELIDTASADNVIVENVPDNNLSTNDIIYHSKDESEQQINTNEQVKIGICFVLTLSA